MAFSVDILSGGLQLVDTFNSYITASANRKVQQKWQEYNNAMVRFQNAQNQNGITTQELIRKESKGAKLLQIQKSERSTLAQAEVSAATTGTVGRSVNMQLFDIQRNAADARANIETTDDYQDIVTQTQRWQSTIAAEMQMDRRPLPSAGSSAALLGIGSTLLNMVKGI